MKVELLVSLKTHEGGVLAKGTVFTDPLPPVIRKELSLNTGTVKVIEDAPQPAQVENPVVVEPPAQVEVTEPEPPPVKKTRAPRRPLK